MNFVYVFATTSLQTRCPTAMPQHMIGTNNVFSSGVITTQTHTPQLWTRQFLQSVSVVFLLMEVIIWICVLQWLLSDRHICVYHQRHICVFCINFAGFPFICGITIFDTRRTVHLKQTSQLLRQVWNKRYSHIMNRRALWYDWSEAADVQVLITWGREDSKDLKRLPGIATHTPHDKQQHITYILIQIPTVFSLM